VEYVWRFLKPLWDKDYRILSHRIIRRALFFVRLLFQRQLAHLIELAYQHYDCQQADQSWKPEQSQQLIGSTVYVETSIELDQNQDLANLSNLPGNVQYKILDFFKFTG